MVAERRNQLEVRACVSASRGWILTRLLSLQRYLRSLFQVVLASSTSPLGPGGLQLTKRDVCDFSPFFRKGVFEYSSHGTG